MISSRRSRHYKLQCPFKNVAAKLSLADHLAEGPKAAEELAGSTGTHASSLCRLMRALASLGILTEDSTHHFALTPLGEALKTGAPGSARATIRPSRVTGGFTALDICYIRLRPEKADLRNRWACQFSIG
jgi:hypothetical protein